MELQPLARILKNKYVNAVKGEIVTSIFLFGIKYSEDIKKHGVARVIEEAGLSKAYNTELTKAVKLAKYVIEK